MLFNKEHLNALLELRPNTVADFCDAYVDVETLADHLERDEPFSRKNFCRYLGVGESTMTGWLKEDRVPLMAKEAFLLPLVLRVLCDEIKRLREEAKQPRILKNGESYQICNFVPDEAGEAIGTVLADKIADLKIARAIISGHQALRLLSQCDKRAIQYGIDLNDGEDVPDFVEDLLELQREIRMCQCYAYNNELWRQNNAPIKAEDVSENYVFEENATIEKEDLS